MRPAWGNPKGLVFTPAGENIFVAEFDSKRDRDRVWEGSPWHVSKNVVILSEFEDCMCPSELKFDKLQLWARVLNLPFNLREDKWCKGIAAQIDKNASGVCFDHAGGYLKARVTVDVNKPLRRWVLIESTKRQITDLYEVQYEQVPHFCFSCGRLGHPDLFCPTPGSRDTNGNLPFGPELRADDRKKSFSADNVSRGKSSTQNSKFASNSYSNAVETGVEVTSPAKKNNINKRKTVTPQKVYRQVAKLLLLTSGPMDGSDAIKLQNEGEPRKKKHTPTSSATSAATARQSCQSQ